jgi:phosphatidate phosphatase
MKMTKQQLSRGTSPETIQPSSIVPILFYFLSLTVTIIIALLLERNVIPSHRRGFFCSDDSIKYPYKEEQTISTRWLFGINFMISIFIFVIGEKYFVPANQASRQQNTQNSQNIISKVYNSNHLWYVRALKLFLSLVWCISATLVITSTIKNTSGSLRPHFLSVCNPNVTCSVNNSSYNINYACQVPTTKEYQKRINIARRSFPSGHASFSAAVMAFNILYVEFRFRLVNLQSPKCKRSMFSPRDDLYSFLRPFLQISFISVASFISMSRVSDYYHHLVDVMVGFLLGTFIGLLVGRQCVKWLRILDINSSFRDPSGTSCIIESGTPYETTCLNELGDPSTKDVSVVVDD